MEAAPEILTFSSIIPFLLYLHFSPSQLHPIRLQTNDLFIFNKIKSRSHQANPTKYKPLSSFDKSISFLILRTSFLKRLLRICFYFASYSFSMPTTPCKRPFIQPFIKTLLSRCSMPGIYVGTEWRFIGEQDWCDSIPQGKTNDFYTEWGVFG